MTEEITYYINTDCINWIVALRHVRNIVIDVYKKAGGDRIQSKCRHCGACAEVCPPGRNQS